MYHTLPQRARLSVPPPLPYPRRVNTPPDPFRPRPWLLACACVCALAWLATWRLIDDPDAFWHLKAGQLALQHGPALPVDTLSWSFAGQPWLGKDALADMLLAAADATFGFVGLAILLAAVLTLGATGLAYGVAPPTWLLAAGLWLSAVEITATPRSRIFSTALLPLLLAAIDRARKSPQKLWILPGMLAGAGLLLHRGGVVGLAILAVAVLTEGLEHRRWRQPVTALALASGLALLHPDGPRVWATVLHVAGSDAYRQYVSEFQPMTFDQAWAAFPMTVLLALLAVPAVLPALQPRGNPDLRWRGVVLLITLLVAGRSPRGMPLLAGAATYALLPLLERLLGLLRRPWLRGALAATVALALVHGNATRPFGAGLNRRVLPIAAADFARRQRLGPRVLNPLHLGGYLMWAGIAPFIDGRNDQLYPDAFFVQNARATDDPAAFAALEQAHKFDWVLAANPGPGQAFLFLAADPAWRLVFWSDVAAIFATRRDLPAYALFSPADPVGSIQRATANPATADAIGAELDRLVADDPEGIAAQIWRVMHLHLRGPAFRQKRDEALARLLSAHRDAPEVLQLLAILKIRLP